MTRISQCPCPSVKRGPLAPRVDSVRGSESGRNPLAERVDHVKHETIQYLTERRTHSQRRNNILPARDSTSSTSNAERTLLAGPS